MPRKTFDPLLIPRVGFHEKRELTKATLSTPFIKRFADLEADTSYLRRSKIQKVESRSAADKSYGAEGEFSLIWRGFPIRTG